MGHRKLHRKDIIPIGQLHEAGMKGHSARLQNIVDAGADIDARDDKYNTTPFYAITQGRKDAVRFLLDLGASRKATKHNLHISVLAAGHPELQAMRRADDGTELHAAVKTGDLDRLRTLIDAGGRGKPGRGDAAPDGAWRGLHAASRAGYTALVLSGSRRNRDVVPLLIAAGAVVGFVEAAPLGDAERLMQLVDEGADI